MKLFERSLNGEWRLRPAGGGKTLRGNVPGDVSYDAFLNGEKPTTAQGTIINCTPTSCKATSNIPAN